MVGVCVMFVLEFRDDDEPESDNATVPKLSDVRAALDSATLRARWRERELAPGVTAFVGHARAGDRRVPFAFVVGPGAAKLADGARDVPAELLPDVDDYQVATCSEGAMLVIASDAENLRPDPKREDLATAVETELQATAGC